MLFNLLSRCDQKKKKNVGGVPFFSFSTCPSKGLCTVLIGGIYWDCTKIYTAIKMMYFMGSPWLLLDQDNASSHSACATTAWFRSECVRLAYL